jgi:hypothetical protein
MRLKVLKSNYKITSNAFFVTQIIENGDILEIAQNVTVVRISLVFSVAFSFYSASSCFQAAIIYRTRRLDIRTASGGV